MVNIATSISAEEHDAAQGSPTLQDAARIMREMLDAQNAYMLSLGQRQRKLNVHHAARERFLRAEQEAFGFLRAAQHQPNYPKSSDGPE